MKTPRKILLARHQAAEPRLDAVRRRAVASLDDEAPARPPAGRSWLAALEEFLRLPRPVLGGLTAAWLIIIALNLASRDTANPASVPMPGRSAAASRETLQALREQKRVLAELVGALHDAESDAPRFVPRPRSEGKPERTYA